MSELNAQIRAAIDTFDKEGARALLSKALTTDPNAETFYLASLVALDESQRQTFLQRAVALDPFHQEAHTALTQGTPLSPSPASPPTPLAAPATPPVRVEPTPVPTTAPSEQEFITATVPQGATLHLYPWQSAPARTTLPAGIAVIPLARTESGNWVNVLYRGTTGNPILGWLGKENLRAAKLGDQPVELLDLPISEFEFNSKQDILDLRTAVGKYIVSRRRRYALPIGGFIMIALAIMGFLADMGGFALVPFVAGAAMVVVGFNTKGGAEAGLIEYNLGESYGGSGTLRMNFDARLDAIRRNKQSATENQMEDQARLFALQTAAQYGGIVLSRVVPNRQQVEIRHRR